jgi:hypothetical protein
VRTASWLAVLLVSGLSGTAQAQCCYIYPPRAPDMLGPGYYLYNCQGYLYGPYHIVRPPFEPFQGMLPGPQMCGGNGGGGMYGGAAAMHPGGIPGLWFHPAVRSPRDFFMVETDPSRSDYRYGIGRGVGVGGVDDRFGDLRGPAAGPMIGGPEIRPAPPPPPAPAPKGPMIGGPMDDK